MSVRPRLDRRRWIIPDATPEGPFTPMGVRHVRVSTTDGELPWQLLLPFVQLIEAQGDLADVAVEVAVDADADADAVFTRMLAVLRERAPQLMS